MKTLMLGCHSAGNCLVARSMNDTGQTATTCVGYMSEKIFDGWKTN